MHINFSEFLKNAQLQDLTKRLPNDLIEKNTTLTLLKKITTQALSFHEVLNQSQKKDLPINATHFTDLRSALMEWMNIFEDNNTFDQCTQKIITHLDNWLPPVKQHARIENKDHAPTIKKTISMSLIISMLMEKNQKTQSDTILIFG